MPATGSYGRRQAQRSSVFPTHQAMTMSQPGFDHATGQNGACYGNSGLMIPGSNASPSVILRLAQSVDASEVAAHVPVVEDGRVREHRGGFVRRKIDPRPASDARAHWRRRCMRASHGRPQIGVGHRQDRQSERCAQPLRWAWVFAADLKNFPRFTQTDALATDRPRGIHGREQKAHLRSGCRDTSVRNSSSAAREGRRGSRTARVCASAYHGVRSSGTRKDDGADYRRSSSSAWCRRTRRSRPSEGIPAAGFFKRPRTELPSGRRGHHPRASAPAAAKRRGRGILAR